MRCADCSLMVHLVLDDELDAHGFSQFHQHLRGCRACAAAFARETAALATRRTALQRHQIPLELAERIHGVRTKVEKEPASSVERRLDAITMRTTPARPTNSLSAVSDRARMVFSGSGGAIAATLLAVTLMRALPEENMTRAIVESHVGALASGRLFDVAGVDPETINRWFTGRLDVTPPVKNLAGRGFDLVGARLEYIAGNRAAAFVYRHREHVLTLYVFSTPNAPIAPSEAMTELGFAVCHWSRQGITRWVVSDMDPEEPEELEEFEKLING